MWTAISTIILLATAVIVGLYTYETHKLRKEAVEQNTFAAITKIHEVMSSWRSYVIREYLHNEFPGHLVWATQSSLGKEYVIKADTKKEWVHTGSSVGGEIYVEMVRESINVQYVLQNLKSDKQKLDNFNRTLGDAKMPLPTFESLPLPGYEQFEGMNALYAVESTLLDFDILALPVSMGSSSALEVAGAYKPVLEATAPSILPFVAIQQRLRGDKDYKKHYLYLLKELNIDLQGLEVPEEEHV